MTAMPDLHALGYLVYHVGQRRWVAALHHDGQRGHIYSTSPLTRAKLERFLGDAQRGYEESWLTSRPVNEGEEA